MTYGVMKPQQIHLTHLSTGATTFCLRSTRSLLTCDVYGMAIYRTVFT